MAWTGQSYRPTADMDFLGHGEDSSERLAELFRDVDEPERLIGPVVNPLYSPAATLRKPALHCPTQADGVCDTTSCWTWPLPECSHRGTPVASQGSLAARHALTDRASFQRLRRSQQP